MNVRWQSWEELSGVEMNEDHPNENKHRLFIQSFVPAKELATVT